MSDASNRGLSRRQALAALAGAGCAAGLCACRKQPPPGPAVRRDWTTPDRRATLLAATERAFPGAGEAGALEFFDRLFVEPAYVGVGQQFDVAARVLESVARQRHHQPFAACKGAEQDALLVAMRKGELSGRGFDGNLFFKRLLVLTVESYLGDPRHGGNRDEVGWNLVGHHSCHFAPRRLELVTAPARGLPW
jgi:gluconate 2-dehydrogenase gamma chain